MDKLSLLMRKIDLIQEKEYINQKLSGVELFDGEIIVKPYGEADPELENRYKEIEIEIEQIENIL